MTTEEKLEWVKEQGGFTSVNWKLNRLALCEEQEKRRCAVSLLRNRYSVAWTHSANDSAGAVQVDGRPAHCENGTSAP